MSTSQHSLGLSHCPQARVWVPRVRKQSRKAALSIDRSVDLRPWALGSDWKNEIVAKMSFRHSVAGLGLRVRLRSSGIRRELGVEQLRELLRFSRHVQTYRMDYSSRLTGERPEVPQEELGKIAGERDIVLSTWVDGYVGQIAQRNVLLLPFAFLLCCVAKKL